LQAGDTATVALAAAGLVLPISRRPWTVGVAMIALVCAAGIALHDGAPASVAPLWGTGLLVAAGLAERAVGMPAAGEVEIDALVTWLAGMGALAAAGLAASAVVLLASSGAVFSSPVAGVLAGVSLAVAPAALAQRVARRSSR
jgi:hypothetical protein